MLKYLNYICLLLILILNVGCNHNQDIKIFLNNNKALSVEPIEDDDSTRESFKITIRQRLDHFGTDTTTFPQKIYLSHVDFTKPMVVVTAGYSANLNQICEPVNILNANQIIIEHRYFGESVPKKMEWKFLNIKQVAEDDHTIIQLFKEIYKAKWLSTGISKGGQTTLYLKYFYPDDVDASVAYVAPINFGKEEPRIFEFLKQVGTESCRQKIYNFQRLLLLNKNKLLPKFIEFSKNNHMNFKMGYEAAYEYCVLEFSFAFWQWGDLNCDSIPINSNNMDAVFDSFKTVGFSFFSEDDIESIRPFFVQALTEIGFYTYDISAFGNLLSEVKNPSFNFTLPEGVDTAYNYKSMRDVNDFLQKKGNNIIYIYGENDPWSASAVQLVPGKTNSIKMVKKGGNHKTRIKDFDSKEKELILNTLKNWLNSPSSKETK